MVSYLWSFMQFDMPIIATWNRPELTNVSNELSDLRSFAVATRDSISSTTTNKKFAFGLSSLLFSMRSIDSFLPLLIPKVAAIELKMMLVGFWFDTREVALM